MILSMFLKERIAYIESHSALKNHLFERWDPSLLSSCNFSFCYIQKIAPVEWQATYLPIIFSIISYLNREPDYGLLCFIHIIEVLLHHIVKCVVHAEHRSKINFSIDQNLIHHHRCFIGICDDFLARLRNYTMQIYLDCYQANDWRVMSKDDYLKRRELQEHALDMCELCLPLIQLAKHHFHLETKRMMYWGKKVIDLRDKIRNWLKSDQARYSEKFV